MTILHVSNNRLTDNKIQGETEHKRIKKWYALTNKNAHEGQIALKQQREKTLADIKKRDQAGSINHTEGNSSRAARKPGRPRKAQAPRDGEELEKTRCDIHHQIAGGRRHHEDILGLRKKHPNDPALKVCELEWISKLSLRCESL